MQFHNRQLTHPSRTEQCNFSLTSRQKTREQSGVLAILRLIPGAGVTPAQGGAEPTVGSALNNVIYPSLTRSSRSCARRLRQANIGMRPRLLESSIDARGLVRSVTRAETDRESVKRPSIFRVLLQIVAKDLLRIRCLASRQQLHPERFTHRKVPRRRLFVVERVLDRDGVLQTLHCVLMMALRCVDLGRERRRR